MNAQADLNVETDQDSEAQEPETDERRDKRRKEWGTQFDKWLIWSAQNSRVIQLQLSQEFSGITKDGNTLEGVPLRVDKDFLQVKVDNSEIWVQKRFIIGCRPIGSAKNNTPQAQQEE